MGHSCQSHFKKISFFNKPNFFFPIRPSPFFPLTAPTAAVLRRAPPSSAWPAPASLRSGETPCRRSHPARRPDARSLAAAAATARSLGLVQGGTAAVGARDVGHGGGVDDGRAGSGPGRLRRPSQRRRMKQGGRMEEGRTSSGDPPRAAAHEAGRRDGRRAEEEGGRQCSPASSGERRCSPARSGERRRWRWSREGDDLHIFPLFIFIFWLKCNLN
jgi:hypothetical protein